MDVNKLEGVIPERILNGLTLEFLVKAGIDGPFRLSHFLGQTEEETGNFACEVENLNYSAQALEALFSRHFPNGDYAAYARQPEKIANRIYANRMGNGDETSGDGWKYRGRGDIQLTGMTTYLAFENWLKADNTEAIDLVANPDLVATAPYDLLSAVWYFCKHGLWAICDKGVDEATIAEVTKVINGGTMNIAERIRYTQTIYHALTN